MGWGSSLSRIKEVISKEEKSHVQFSNVNRFLDGTVIYIMTSNYKR